MAVFLAGCAHTIRTDVSSFGPAQYIPPGARIAIVAGNPQQASAPDFLAFRSDLAGKLSARGYTLVAPNDRPDYIGEFSFGTVQEIQVEHRYYAPPPVVSFGYGFGYGGYGRWRHPYQNFGFGFAQPLYPYGYPYGSEEFIEHPIYTHTLSLVLHRPDNGAPVYQSTLSGVTDCSRTVPVLTRLVDEMVHDFPQELRASTDLDIPSGQCH